MLRIALCDDDAQFMSVLQRQIESWFQKNEERHYNVFISRFSSSEYFASVLKENYFDIVFLDIEMPKLDGMKLARIVREQMPHSIIVFLTSYDEFAPDGYKVQALRCEAYFHAGPPRSFEFLPRNGYEQNRSVLICDFYRCSGSCCACSKVYLWWLLCFSHYITWFIKFPIVFAASVCFCRVAWV